MAYYNASIGTDDSNRYYSPESSNPLSDVGKQLATTFAVSIVGTGIELALTKHVVGLAKTTLKSWASSEKSLIRRSFANKTISAYNSFNKSVEPFKRALAESSIGKAVSQRQEELASIQKSGMPGYGLARVRTAFQSKNAFIGTMAGVWKKNVLACVATSFATDYALGFLPSMGWEKKKWYDLPGHLSNASKWLGWTSFWGIAFGGIGPVAGAIGAKGFQATQKAFQGSFGKKVLTFMADVSGKGLPRGDTFGRFSKKSEVTFFNKQVLANLHSQQEQNMMRESSKKLLSFTDTVAHMYRNVNDALYTLPDAFKESLRMRNASLGARTQKAFQPIANALKAVKDLKRIPHKAPVYSKLDYEGLHNALALQEYAQQGVKQGEVKGVKKVSLDQDSMFQTFMREAKAVSGRQSVFGKITGLAPLYNKDVLSDEWKKEVHGQLVLMGHNKSSADMLMGTVLNLKAGRNLYRDWRGNRSSGGGVCLNAFDPLHLMRRGASAIANIKFRIPLAAPNGMTLNDLLGLSKYLEESPELILTTKRPVIELNDKNFSNKASVGELVDPDQPALFIYQNGKYAAIDSTGPKVVDTGRLLHYAHHTSKEKADELRRIAVRRTQIHLMSKRDPVQAAAEFNRWKDSIEHDRMPKNQYLGFLYRHNITVPKKLEEILDGITAKLTGSKESESHIATFFDGTGPNDQKMLPIIDSVFGHTSQTFSKILHTKEALLCIGKYVHNVKLKKDIYKAYVSDRSLIKQAEMGAERGDEWMKDSNVVRALEDIKAFPATSKIHEVKNRLGSLAPQTSYDVARTSYIGNQLTEHWLESGDTINHHPLIVALPALKKAGLITEKEAKHLDLYAKLSVFKHQGLLNGRSSIAPDLFRGIIKRTKEEDWQLSKEVIEFMSSKDVRRARYTRTLDRSLPKELQVLTGLSEHLGDTSPFASSPKGFGGVLDILTRAADSTNSMLSDWLPYRKQVISHAGFVGNIKYMGGLLGTSALAFGAYRILDTVVATSPLTQGTMFNEGLTGAAADTLAKVRLGTARLADVTGVTATMKYLHGLAPFSESSLPGAVAGGVIGMALNKGPFSIAKAMAYGALTNRILSPYLPDPTKSYEELKEIYSGRQEVPMMKSPTWLIGSTPWEGSKVIGYSPNWYVRAKSRWKETDTLYGSAFRRLIHEPLPLIGMNIGDMIDPYYMERKHFFDRSYPQTGGAFDEVPIIGKIMSNTIGRIIKPPKTMHQEFLTRGFSSSNEAYNPYVFAVRPPTVAENEVRMNMGANPIRSLTGVTMNAGGLEYNEVEPEVAGEDFLYDMVDFAGLKGFLAGSIGQRIFNVPKVIPTLQTAGRIASFSRSYYDMNLGGMGIFTEGLRRVLEKPLYKQYGQNPIPNLMPNWLPSQFLVGDPFQQILRGELRLPGAAYSATHTDLKRTMPGRSSMLGGTEAELTQYFAGLLPPVLKEEYDIMEKGTEFHESVQNMLAEEGLLVKAEALVNDVKNDITGHVDAIIRDGKGGGGRRALEIKTINDAAFQKLEGPIGHHVSQLNFYLRELHLRKGTFLYINRDNPSEVKTFTIHYNPVKWEKDLKKLQKARFAASTMLQEGTADNYGYSYSWADRLNILADVAPTSLEFKEAKSIVEKQIKYHAVSDNDIKKYQYALQKKQARIRKYELYPRRFKFGHLMSPDTQANIESINTDIKAASEYSLPARAVGWLWEKFTNTNTFLVNKFFAAKDPLEHYKSLQLYGQEYKPWDEPIRSWAKPYMRSLASKEDPVTGAISWGSIGTVFGGRIGAAAGGIAGSIWGTLNGMTHSIGDKAYIPGNVKEKRELSSFFDVLKYERNKMMADISDGLVSQEYQSAEQGTLTAYNQGGPGANVANLFRGTGTQERPYIESWLNETDPGRRKEILKYIPEDLAQALRTQWNKTDNYDATSNYVGNASVPNRKYYQFDRSLLDPSVNMEDIQLKTVQEAGYNCLLPEEQILTNKGYKSINKITTNDYILNGNNEYKQPVKIITSNHNKEVYRLKCKGILDSLNITGNHRLMVAKKCWNFKFKEISVKQIKKYNRLYLCNIPLNESLKNIYNIDLDSDFGYVCGWWLAEGNYLKSDNKKIKGIQFSLSLYEEEDVIHICKILKQKFGGNPYYKKYPKHRVIILKYYNVNISNIFYSLFNEYSYSKSISSQLLNAPHIFLINMIKSWFDGDGWETKKETCVHTNSKSLMESMFLILRAFGFHVLQQYIKSKKIKDTKYISHEGYRLRIGNINEREKFKSFDWKYTIFTTISIKNITRYEYKGLVYDIEMPDNHFYTTKLATIHNSHDFGLGWNEQLLRMQDKSYRPVDIHEFNKSSNNLSSAAVRGVINNLFSRDGIHSSANVYINNNDDYNVVNLIVKRDRSRTIVNALTMRNKYAR